MSGLDITRTDALHFTSLPSTITQLAMINVRFSDLALAAMLPRLTGLRELLLDGLRLESELVWATVGAMTGLRSLKLVRSLPIRLTDATLHLLAPLTGLTELMLDGPDEYADEEEPDGQPVSADVQEAFLAGMPQLRTLTWV